MCDDDALTAFRRNHNGCLRVSAREGATSQMARCCLPPLQPGWRMFPCAVWAGGDGARVFVCMRSGAGSLFGPFTRAGILVLFVSLLVATAFVGGGGAPRWYDAFGPRSACDAEAEGEVGTGSRHRWVVDAPKRRVPSWSERTALRRRPRQCVVRAEIIREHKVSRGCAATAARASRHSRSMRLMKRASKNLPRLKNTM